jgi:hypothetical protein
MAPDISQVDADHRGNPGLSVRDFSDEVLRWLLHGNSLLLRGPAHPISVYQHLSMSAMAILHQLRARHLKPPKLVKRKTSEPNPSVKPASMCEVVSSLVSRAGRDGLGDSRLRTLR